MKDSLNKKIILAAIKLGAEKGIENISIKEIGEQCGVSSAAMYYHYKNKYDLMFKSTFYVVKQLSKVINKTMDPDRSFESNYKRSLFAIAEYDLSHTDESMFYNRMLIIPNMILEDRDLMEILSYCPLRRFLNKGIEDGIIIDIPSILSLAYYPLCTFLMHHIVKGIAPEKAVLGNYIDSLWKAISLEYTGCRPQADSAAI